MKTPVLCAKANVDLGQFWEKLRSEAEALVENEYTLRPLVSDVILSQESFAQCVAMRLSRKLAREDMTREQIFSILTEVIAENPDILNSIARDLTKGFMPSQITESRTFYGSKSGLRLLTPFRASETKFSK